MGVALILVLLSLSKLKLKKNMHTTSHLKSIRVYAKGAYLQSCNMWPLACVCGNVAYMCGNVLLDTLSNSHFNYRLLTKVFKSG